MCATQLLCNTKYQAKRYNCPNGQFLKFGKVQASKKISAKPGIGCAGMSGRKASTWCLVKARQAEQAMV